MNQSTQDLLRQFQCLQWFHAVGKPVQDAAVQRVGMWIEALQCFTDGFWEMKGYMAALEQEKELMAKAPNDLPTWKNAEIEFQGISRALVEQKLEQIRTEHGWPKLLNMIISYDITHALLEAEFAGMVSRGFFTDKTHWYLEGHFPCGMSQDGKLVVF